MTYRYAQKQMVNKGVVEKNKRRQSTENHSEKDIDKKAKKQTRKHLEMNALKIQGARETTKKIGLTQKETERPANK